MTKEDLKAFYTMLENEIERVRSKKEIATNDINFNYYLGNELAYQTALMYAKIRFGEAE